MEGNDDEIFRRKQPSPPARWAVVNYLRALGPIPFLSCSSGKRFASPYSQRATDRPDATA